jgi:predicted metal-dependent hydrolase
MPTSPLKYCELKSGPETVRIPYEVHRRRGLRHLRVVVSDPTRVYLKVPYRVSEATALDFLRQQGAWVLQAMARLPVPEALADFLARQGWVSGGGRSWKVVMEERGGRAGFRVEEEAGVLRIHTNPALPVERQLRRVLREFAAAIIPPRVRELAEPHGLQPTKITVRDQRRRWGACTNRSTLSLNWRLILLPPELHDHILFHELAHLRHLDHSVAFWNFLQKLDPQTRKHDRALTRISSGLMGLGT